MNSLCNDQVYCDNTIKLLFIKSIIWVYVYNYKSILSLKPILIR